MAISVDPLTHVITVPKTDLTLIQSSPTEIRGLDLDDFRKWLRAWEDSEEGMVQLKTHDHNTEVSLAGTIYARIIEILDPYTVEFEDGQYTVNCSGANHNLLDVKVVNQVSLLVNNAAGLIVSVQGSGVTSQDKTDIIDGVWDELVVEHTSTGTMGEKLSNTGESNSLEDIADAVWDEARSEHTDAGSFGATDEWAGEVDEDAIADAVWDEQRDEHEDTGSFGAVAEWAGIGGGLTEEETAAAVWNAIAVTYGTPGTMGWLQNLIDEGIISVPKLIPGE